MNKALLKGSLIGGLFLFLWYAIVQMIPGHQSPIKLFNNQANVVAVFEENAPAVPGMYFLNKVGDNAVGEGVWGWISIQRFEDYSLIKLLVGSLIQQIVVAFGLTWILLKLGHLSFGKRLGTLMIIAISATFAGSISFWNWSLLSAPFAIVMSLDLLSGWFLAGFILAKLLPSNNMV